MEDVDVDIDFEDMRKNWIADIPFDMAFGIRGNELHNEEISQYYEESFKIMEDYITTLDAMMEARKK